MRVLDSSQVSGPHDVHSEVTVEAVVPTSWLVSPKSSQSIFCLLLPLVLEQDLLSDLCLSRMKLVIRLQVLLGELVKFNKTIAISVTCLENDFDNLIPVIFINASLSQEVVHFISVDLATSINVDLVELTSQSSDHILLWTTITAKTPWNALVAATETSLILSHLHVALSWSVDDCGLLASTKLIETTHILLT
jgi:hypothetical protein